MRTASEVLRSLEARVARLEKSSSFATKEDLIEAVENPREFGNVLRDLRVDFFNNLTRYLEQKSEMVADAGVDWRGEGIIVKGEKSITNGSTVNLDQVNTKDLMMGKLLVPCMVKVRLFYKKPQALPMTVKLSPRKTGTKHFWAYVASPTDAQDKNELIKDIKSFCASTDYAEYLNIEYPKVVNGRYEGIYATATILLDMSDTLKV